MYPVGYGESSASVLSPGTPRLVSIRRLGKEGQQVMPLDAALKSLADEAVAPDVRRLKEAA
jgi:hypothetical protein